jgi:type I restriction enzyme S subunit
MPLIQTGDIANSGMYISSCSFGYSELGVAQSKIWHKGTLCITIAANIGKCAIMTFDACFPDSVVGFIADSSVAKVEYVYFYFLWIQQALEGDAMGVAQKNINLGVLNSMNIPVPPIELQDSFIEYVKKVNAANAIINQEITNLEELLESKMDEYFGEKDEP